jgi:hypothetical protein
MAEAHAFALTVATIRRARGKPNPEDYAVDSPEWHEIAEDLARDVLCMLECECDSDGLCETRLIAAITRKREAPRVSSKAVGSKSLL